MNTQARRLLILGACCCMGLQECRLGECVGHILCVHTYPYTDIMSARESSSSVRHTTTISPALQPPPATHTLHLSATCTSTPPSSPKSRTNGTSTPCPSALTKQSTASRCTCHISTKCYPCKPLLHSSPFYLQYPLSPRLTSGNRTDTTHPSNPTPQPSPSFPS